MDRLHTVSISYSIGDKIYIPVDGREGFLKGTLISIHRHPVTFEVELEIKEEDGTKSFHLLPCVANGFTAKQTKEYELG